MRQSRSVPWKPADFQTSFAEEADKDDKSEDRPHTDASGAANVRQNT